MAKKGRTMLAGFSDVLDAAEAKPAVDAEDKFDLMMQLKTARQSGDLPAAVSLRSQLLASAETDDERVTMLQGLAEDSLAAAANALDRALKIKAKEPNLLRRLRAVYEAAGLWREAVDAGVQYAETITQPGDRARALVSAAELSARDPEGVSRATALYEAALEDAPGEPGVFESMEKLLDQAADHKGLEGAYDRQIARLKKAGNETAELPLYDKLANLREVKLGDKKGAIKALDKLVARRQQDAEARGRLAKLLEVVGRDDLAIRCLEIGTQHTPAHAGTYRSMHRVLKRTGDLDRAYQACSVLVQLGEAEMEEQLFYQQHAPRTTAGASKALDGNGWGALLPPTLDRELTSVLLATAPAGVAARLDQMRAAKQLPALDSKDKQDPEKSTVSAVRAVAYASWVLGLPTPAIYTTKNDVPGGIALLPTPEPAVLLGASVLAGRSVPELTFVAGRNLAALRTSERVLSFYPTLPDLQTLLSAAFATAGSSAAGSVSPDAITLARALAGKLDAGAKQRLAEAVKRLVERGGEIDLVGWARATEIMACRAALLASGDITVAARMLSFDGRVIGGLSAADRLKALLPFCVSAEHASLRKATGSAISAPAA